MTDSLVFAVDIGWRAFPLLYIWLLSAIGAAELSRSKGYGEKVGLGTGLLLSILGPIIWLFIPVKDDLAEWNERKPWQRRKVKRDAVTSGATGADPGATSGTGAASGDPGAGSRPGESRA